MNWNYVEQGQQMGPVTGEQLAEMVGSGRLNEETLVWRAGLADWVPYSTAKAEILPQRGAPPALAAANPPQAGEVACTECGKIFPVDETIRHGNARVCAACKPVFLQKLAEGARINTGALNLASIGNRFAAVFLDGLMLSVINIGLRLAVGVSMTRSTGVPVGLQVILFAVNTIIGMSYETFMIGKYGATLGKMACKIKVVTADGGKLTYARACGRYFAKMLSAFTLMIGYIMAIFDKEKRALHDRICNTRVINK